LATADTARRHRHQSRRHAPRDAPITRSVMATLAPERFRRIRMRLIVTLIVLLAASCATGQEPVALNVAAPELAGITDWVNSKPLTLADLKGQVVVLHFWTHGCIN